MNKIFLLILVLFMVSCTERTADKHAEEGEVTNSETTTIEKATSEIKEEHDARLQLNNGQKWRLDESTRLNMAALKQILSGSEEKIYLVKSARGQTDKLIREWRMQGAEHEALHTWLNSFLEHLREAETGKGDVGELKEDILEFYNYFE